MRAYIEEDNSQEYVVSLIEPFDEVTHLVLKEIRWR